MKIKLDFYDVTLDVTIDNKCVIDDTVITPENQFLNLLSIICNEAAENVKRKGYDALEERYKEISDNIYDYLKEQGVYENVQV